MKNKMMVLAAGALTAIAFAALPSMASAGGWDIDPPGVSVNAAGGQAKLTTTSLTVTCASNSGSGAYHAGNQTTGSIELTFKNCTGPFGVACTTSGQANGTITTTSVEFHNIYIDPNKTTPGLLITSNAGHFATFSCLGIKTVVSGNGIIGHIRTPKCGETSTTATLDFESTSAGQQKYKQVTTAGTFFDLTSSTGGGAAATSSLDAEGTVTFGSAATMTCI